MRILKLVCLMVMTGLLMILGGCQRDEQNFELNNKEKFQNSNWTSNEVNFFNLNFETNVKIRSKVDISTSKIIFHPKIISLYNEINLENQRLHYIDNFVAKYGVPIWKKALVYENIAKTEAAILLQMTDGVKATGIITAIKNENDSKFKITFTSKAKLLQNNINCNHYKKIFERIKKLDDDLNYVDPTFQEAYCNCAQHLVNPTPTSEPCEWMFIELCDGEPTYAGGYSSFPLYLDHDSDGILNIDDQDWLEWSDRHGFVSQDEFRDKFI